MIKCDHCEGWGLVYQPTGQAINLVKCRECFGIGKILELDRYPDDNLNPNEGNPYDLSWRKENGCKL